MTRQQWIWLWIWLLAFLIIFCVWSNINALQDKQPSPALKVEKAQEPTVKIVKNDKEVIISGLFSNPNTPNDIIKQYKLFSQNVKKENISIEQNLSKLACFGMIQNLAHHFLTNFNNASIECNNTTFSIKGDVVSKAIKDEANKIITAYNFGELNIHDNISIITPKTHKQKAHKELYDLLSLKVIEFIQAKDIMTGETQMLLDEVFQTLNRYTNLKIQIQGHTDSDGDKNSNQLLSEKRAIAVKDYLIKKGIDSQRISTIGFGEAKPIVENDSQTNKQRNRRVEFIILGE